MKLYKIRDWNEKYENNRTRELKKLDWLPIPNKQDGDGYTLVMEHKDGAAIFGAWIACAQIASRCEPRGTLLRDGKKPHDSASISRMSRIPVKIIEAMLELVSSPDVNWLEINEITTECDNPASSCDNPAEGCLEGKGRESTEGNGKNGMESCRMVETDARIILHLLNEQTGRHYRESSESLTPIIARMSEPEVTLEGVKQMVARQVAMWMGSSMEEFLRPATLFGKEKFNGYYAGKDQPVIKHQVNGSNHTKNHVKPDYKSGF